MLACPMLTELIIKDLALIESLSLELGAGLNALTGETGAGKSLLVGSLELLRGETPRGGAAQWVRKGAKEARVEGRFELSGKPAIEALLGALQETLPAVAEALEEAREGDRVELFLGRSLTKDGRTKAHIQQRPVPLRALKAIAPQVLEIHGQNDHQLLFQAPEQLRLLDAHGALGKTLAGYRAQRAAWLELRERFDALQAAQEERRDRGDLLRYQINELDEAELAEGEHQRLSEERDLLRVASDLRAELGGLAGELVERDDALVDRVRQAIVAVERWRGSMPSLEAPLEDLNSAEIHLSEAASALGSLVDGVSADPARLEVVEERLSELERLEAKYRADESGLLQLSAGLHAELLELQAADESLAGLEDEIEVAHGALAKAAATLAKKRKALVPKLVATIEKTLGSLGLGRARFDVQFEVREGDERFGVDGTQRVEFLLAANAGEESAPLRNVASGGEAARIMLALRTALQPGKRAGVASRTLVFDEIDAGVGGRLGPEVGEHLHRLGQREQVLCVTHTPAIAAWADLHLCSSKEVKSGRTRTTIVPVEGELRVAEVADMIAGGSAHATARAEAKRLLEANAF